LSADEQARAARFTHERDRRRFAQARSFLRRVLADYLGIAPLAVEFEYAQYGKPHIDGLFFNLSHAHELAVLAVSDSIAVGIDIEYRQRDINVRDLARRFFTADEYAYLDSQPAALQHHLFLRYWTAKEAYLKATGEGLRALEYARITRLEPLQLNDPRPQMPAYELHALTVADEYIGALAIATAAPIVYC
jgi:4'-phosphopantetheinyl transferase